MEHTPDPGAIVRMPPMVMPPQRRGPVISIVCAVATLALLIGIGIGRATVEVPEPATPAAGPDRGKLKVLSSPADGNVVVDGRFVGVAPLEGLDLDPGKHSIVVDLFAYQPYAGTIEIDPHGHAKLSVVLAPLGDATGTTTGKVDGGGTATRVKVPASALLPSAITDNPKSTPKPAAPAPRYVPSYTPDPTPSYTPPPPPPRPRRNCSGENSTCRDGCSRAEFDCRSSCPNCGSCPSSVGWDQCKVQCDTCRNGCDQNKKFCESSCESQNRNCDASNNQ